MAENHGTTGGAARGAAGRPVEEGFERMLVSARWLMAPIYLGLAIALALLAWMFVRELIGQIPTMLTGPADAAVLSALSLVSLALVANLVLIVLVAGYENFVSRIVQRDGDPRPDWMGKVDHAALKMKLVGAVIAVAAIELLRRFLEIGQGSGEALDEARLYWMTAMLAVFVIAGLLMAVMDWLGARSGGKQ